MSRRKMGTEHAEDVFILRERWIKHDCYEICCSKNGIVLYYIHGRPLYHILRHGEHNYNAQKHIDNMSTKKTMFNPRNSRIFVKNELRGSLRQDQYIYDYRSKKVYSLRKKGFLPFQGRDTVFVFEGKEEEGGEKMLEVKAPGNRRLLTIVEIKTGNILATIKRLDIGVVSDYKITISSDYDKALIFMIASCLDEQYFYSHR